MHATICDYIADTVQNSIEAGASRIDATLTENGEIVEIAVKDNGKGMDEETLSHAWNPFYTEQGKHDKRRVGLGLPLLRQAVEATGGSFSIESAPGKGTEIIYSFGATHPDTPPLGNVAEAVVSLMNYASNCDFRFTHSRCADSYSISRGELEEALGDLRDASNLAFAKAFLKDQESDLEARETFATITFSSTKYSAAARGQDTAENRKGVNNGETDA